MKKILFGMVAAAVLATSCAKELQDVAAGDATVTFTVGTPEIATRAYSDGATATVLQYAVYDEAGVLLPDLTKTDATINGSTTVELQLTTGNTYYVIFWAAASNAPYTVDFATKTMTVDYSAAVSNDEARDAFFKLHTFTVTGDQTETIELRRPFAQLNIGTADYAASTSAGYTPVKSAVTVKRIYSTLNLWNGDVTNEAEVTYDYAEIAKNEAFPVAGYQYLAMNYLLVAADKDLVDIEFGYTETDATAAKTRIVGSVPVQRNFRTNIYGNLLTSDVDINVEIKPDYNEPAHELDALHKAALNGGEYILEEDVVLTYPLEVKSNLTLNLNGKTISGNYHKNDGAIIKNYGTMTITGGTISSTGENGGSAVQNNGTMTINDVILNGAPNANGSWPSYTVNNTGELTITDSEITSYHGAVASYGEGAIVNLNNSIIDMAGIPGFTSHGIYTYDSGRVIVNGGTYENKATDQAASGASVINGAVEVNAGDFSGRIENYYDTPVLKGGSFSVKPKDNFIAAGMKAVEKDGRYYVVEASGAIVSNASELKAAIDANNTTIYMKAGTYDTKDFQVINKSLCLKGMEGGVKIFNSQSNDVACTSFDGCIITFENLTIETLGGLYKGFARMNGTYKNCTIVNNYFTCFGKHVFENCTFNAPTLTGSFKNEHCVWTYGAAEVDFVDCIFNYSDRCVNVYVDNGGNAPGITSDVEFTNCEFNTTNTGSEGAVEVNSTPFTAGVNVVLKNCTAPSYGKMVYVSPWDATKGKTASIIVDGKIVAGLASALANATTGSTIVLSENANLGTVEVGELKDVTIKGDGTNVMVFKTNANTKIENVTLQNVKFEYTGATADCGVVIDPNAQIDNLVIENGTFVGTGAKAGRGLSGNNANASIEIKNCTFKDMGYPVYAWGGYESLTIEACVFENIKSWAVMPQSGFDGDLTVTGCTFKDCLGGGLIKAGTLTAGHTFTFTNNTITGCTVAGDHNWFQFNVSAGTSVIEDNTKDGAAWTPGAADGLK